MPSTSDLVGRIGLFWGLPKWTELELVSFSRPEHEVPEIGGFKTLPEGHIDLWPLVKKKRPLLIGTDYERYPRGRVNQVMSTGRFIVLADRQLLTDAVIKFILRRFSLEQSNSDFCTDAHYRTNTF
ncbi:MAG: hypothetical protein DCE92_01990 [Alphaproteobacteria bacterium]|nr:MAG: hypothetical protein DCE92_01990 [Alphaproteobacteria bacterium]